MSSNDSPTIGELFLTLREMGFSDEQIQAAVKAGHFSVAEAAEWLLQGPHPRHTLLKQSSPPSEMAFSAFNPPKVVLGSSSHSPSSDSQACAQSSKSPSPPPLESRIKQDKSDFEEKERQRLAQEVKAEKRLKKQERDLVLKRIADDRRNKQEKIQTNPATDTSPTSQGQKLGGKIHTNVDNKCILMIRLPSGESMRERFPADAPLQSVMEHITRRHPTLGPFSLVQGFPRRRFGEADLACSLHSLGLTPNAALCIQTTPPETPQDSSSRAESPAAVQQDLPVSIVPPEPPFQEGPERPNPVPPLMLPNHLWEEAVNYAGIPDAAPALAGSLHFWGRGQRLVPGDLEAPGVGGGGEEQPDEELPDLLNEMPRLPFFPENRIREGFVPRHHWPEQGNRLRDAPEEEVADPEESGGPVAPVAAGLAAVERLQRAAQQEDPNTSQGQPSPPKRAFRTMSVPSLCSLATRATVQLMTAPSMQYSSSLAGLTPELVELLLNHMSKERLLRPRTLELFFGCPLQKFVLNCYPYLTNELLRQLRAFPALKHLSLVNSPLITDSGLSILSNLIKLQHLNLASCNKLTDACLQYITGLKNLCFLSLDQTKVSDVGMVTYLHSAPSCLFQLSLNQTAVTEATLAILPTCIPQLRFLSIKQTQVRELTGLAEMSCLQTLIVDGTNVTEVSLLNIANHSTLTSLSLGGISVQDGNRTLQIISGLKLTHLTLPGRHIVTDSGLSHLCKLSLLLELDLTDYTQVTDQGVGHLSTMTRLKKLSLSNTQVTDAGLPFMRGLQELQELCLDRTAVTSRGVADLVICLPLLQVLGLASTQVGDTVVRRGLIHCHQLLKLNLSRTRITDQGIKYLKSMRLAQVNLDGTGVSVVGITSLLSLTNISSIRASNIRTIPLDEVSDDE